MMFINRVPTRMLGFVFLTFTLYVLGPSFQDFSSSSWVEFVVFYIHVWVLFFAGVFMKGVVNRRAVLLFGLSLVANHFLFFWFLEQVGSYTYAKLWCFVVSGLPMYLVFTYYTTIQARLLSFLDGRVSDSVADKVVGPLGTTNFWLLCSGYATFWIVIDFLVGAYASLYGLYFDVPGVGGRITPVMVENGPFNIYALYDSIVMLTDSVFAVLLASRVLQDQKRPDALGLGRFMTWDKKRVTGLGRAS
jgi:hypothetical protein